LNLSTGLTSASAQLTNANVTTLTAATLLNTNAVSTNVSSATLNLSTGLTSASAQLTNANVTALTAASAQLTNATISTARVTSNLLALGNSNTLGNLFTTGGNLGIGTTAPSALLDVSGGNMKLTGAAQVTTLSDNIFFNVSAADSVNSNGGTTVYSNSINLKAGDLTWGGGTVRVPGAQIYIGGGYSINAAVNPADIKMSTGGTERVRITGAGNIGIGTSAPGEVLQVNGNIMSNLTYQQKSNYTLVNGTNTSAWYKLASFSGDTYAEFMLSCSAPNDHMQIKFSVSSCFGNSPRITILSSSTFYNQTIQQLRIARDANAGNGSTSYVEFYTNSTFFANIPLNCYLLFQNQELNNMTLYQSLTPGSTGLIYLPINASIAFGINAAGSLFTVMSAGNVNLGGPSGAFDPASYGQLQITMDDTDTSSRSHITLVRSGLNILSMKLNASNQFVINYAGNGVYLPINGTSWSAVSDRRKKTDFIDFVTPLDKLAQIKGTYYRYLTDAEDTKRVGVIAQDVQAVLPEAVSEDVNGFLGVSYTDLIPLTIEACKELKGKNDSLQAEVDTLKATNASILARLAALEQK
jgi:hypothetical protein